MHHNIQTNSVQKKEGKKEHTVISLSFKLFHHTTMALSLHPYNSVVKDKTAELREGDASQFPTAGKLYAPGAQEKEEEEKSAKGATEREEEKSPSACTFRHVVPDTKLLHHHSHKAQ